MILFINLFSLLLTQNQPNEHIIESQYLGYKIRYWVYVPAGYQDQKLPVLYVTDGYWYKESGDILSISQKLIDKGKIKPHITVLVDAFDPDNPQINRRNSQFFCNSMYVRFYRNELIPQIARDYKPNGDRNERGMLGLSFGGLNSMYFALTANDTFGKIGIQSPAPHPCPDIYRRFETTERLPVDIFLSTGTENDKEIATKRLKRILDKKGYEFKYREVPYGHDWKNWKPLLDDVLIYFYRI